MKRIGVFLMMVVLMSSCAITRQTLDTKMTKGKDGETSREGNLKKTAMSSIGKQDATQATEIRLSPDGTVSLSDGAETTQDTTQAVDLLKAVASIYAPLLQASNPGTSPTVLERIENLSEQVQRLRELIDLLRKP